MIDVMILRIFSLQNSAKKLAFLAQNKAKLCKILIITLVFEKNANFFAENCHKSPKIVIITSIPDSQKSKIKCYAKTDVPNESIKRQPEFYLAHHFKNQ
jgi:hypothetical protein